MNYIFCNPRISEHKIEYVKGNIIDDYKKIKTTDKLPLFYSLYHAIKSVENNGGCIIIDDIKTLVKTECIHNGENYDGIFLYIVAINNKVDIRFINTPNFNTSIIFKMLARKADAEIITQIYKEQLQVIKKSILETKEYIGQRTKEQLKASVESGIIPKAKFRNKKYLEAERFIVEFFEENLEYPKYKTYCEYMENSDKISVTKETYASYLEYIQTNDINSTNFGTLTARREYDKLTWDLWGI